MCASQSKHRCISEQRCPNQPQELLQKARKIPAVFWHQLGSPVVDPFLTACGKGFQICWYPPGIWQFWYTSLTLEHQPLKFGILQCHDFTLFRWIFTNFMRFLQRHPLKAQLLQTFVVVESKGFFHTRAVGEPHKSNRHHPGLQG